MVNLQYQLETHHLKLNQLFTVMGDALSKYDPHLTSHTPQNRAAKVGNAGKYVANAKKMRTHPNADDWAVQLQARIGHSMYRKS